jgi:hypothetical protein
MGKKTLIIQVTEAMKKDMEQFCTKYEITLAHLVRRAVKRELETDK